MERQSLFTTTKTSGLTSENVGNVAKVKDQPRIHTGCTPAGR